MGKQPSPSPEELEFIFKCFGDGLDNNEVKYEIENTSFTPRKIRFIRDRRREYDAAKKVLQSEVQKQHDPLMIERMKEHHYQLADIAAKLLTGLGLISKGSGKEIDKYYIGSSLGGEYVTEGQLLDIFEGNKHEVTEIHGDMMLASFSAHLEAEDSEIKGLWEAFEENPVKLTEILSMLSNRKTFKGTCKICEAWK
jgi:hypothetical protein